MNFLVKEIRILSENTKMYRMVFGDDTPLVDKASPGMYFKFNLKDDFGNNLERCYTYVSSVDEFSYDFIVKDNGNDSKSSLSLNRLTQGDIIEVDGPYGEVTYDKIRDKNRILLISGGIGLTLPLAIIREIFKIYRYECSNKNVTLDLSNANTTTISFLNELLDLHFHSDWFTLKLNITQQTPKKNNSIISHGRINENNYLLTPQQDVIIICGGKTFAKDIRSIVTNKFPNADIFIEAFDSEYDHSLLVNLESESLKINLINSGESVSSRLDSNILDTLLEKKIKIRNMCRSGICGSCKFKLHKGNVVRGLEFCLSNNDIDQNIYLACCTTQKSDIDIELL